MDRDKKVENAPNRWANHPDPEVRLLAATCDVQTGRCIAHIAERDVLVKSLKKEQTYCKAVVTRAETAERDAKELEDRLEVAERERDALAHLVDHAHDILWSAEHRGEDVVGMAARVKQERDEARTELDERISMCRKMTDAAEQALKREAELRAEADRLHAERDALHKELRRTRDLAANLSTAMAERDALQVEVDHLRAYYGPPPSPRDVERPIVFGALDALLARQPALDEHYHRSAIVHAVVERGIVARKTDEEILAIAVTELCRQADRLSEELIRSESDAVRTIDFRCEECGKTTRLVPKRVISYGPKTETT